MSQSPQIEHLVKDLNGVSYFCELIARPLVSIERKCGSKLQIDLSDLRPRKEVSEDRKFLGLVSLQECLQRRERGIRERPKPRRRFDFLAHPCANSGNNRVC